ncbi:MAG: sulfotransferase [Bacteroidales bacterium]|jgi:hypothetical protein
MTEQSNKPFFFIVGRPRSGTTLLRTLFDANPHTVIPPESQFVVNLFPKYGSVTNWNRPLLMEFIQDVQKQWLFSTWRIPEDELKGALLRMTGDHSYGDICKEVYLKYNSIFTKDKILFFGDKNPGYTIYTELLAKIFPGAKFIHIIRDYRDHFVSVQNVDFELPLISLVAYKWRLYVRHFRNMVKKFPDTHTEVRYEDLVKQPETEMKRLCKFTGVPFDPKILDFHEYSEIAKHRTVTHLFEKFHSNLFKRINTDKIGVYKNKLNKRQIKIADTAVGKYAGLAGYKKEYENPGIWYFLLAFPGIVIALLLQLLTKLVNRFPYNWRERILSRWPLQVATFYLKLFNTKKLTGLHDL